jgi:N-acyl-D-aspartate/D-glutamate deacylase
MQLDTVIRGGTVFDGKGSPGKLADLGIRDGKVAAIGEGLAAPAIVDAAGKWVMPGFIDLHTHYDAEVELAPALSESLRHGVTTVVMGSCSLSLALGTPEDLADMFCRVEAIPYEVVRPLLDRSKSWETVGEYLQHLGELPLGPNVASFLGHSAIRAHVMGLGRSLERGVRPSESELRRMEDLLDEGLDAGYLGLSVMTLRWDKMGGSREYRSRPLPSTYARWSEYRRLTRHLRARGRIFQGVPDVTTKVNALLFLLESMGIGRPRLRTTIISLMDIRANRSIWRVVGAIARFCNRFLRSDFRLQALPEVFDLWADGMDLVVFEEFGAGTDALHLADLQARAELLRDPAYRAKFRKQWTSRFLPRAFHRDFNQSEILACPDGELVGKSFAEIAAARGEHVVDTFLDLVARHGPALRWYTIMGNDRRAPLEKIVSHPDVLIGFSDAGAHLRNMAHYNFPLRLLRLVKDAAAEGRPFMTVERAVERLTGEIAGWLGLDAGVLEEGKRADVVVVDPAGIDATVDAVDEAEIPGFHGFRRLVRRNDRAVAAVLVNGKVAVEGGRVGEDVGRTRGFGQVLRAS